MSDDLSVDEALAEFYRMHDFGPEALNPGPWVTIKLGPLRFPFPNLPQRREAIHLHDLQHILLGYDTSWVGEGEIAAWELVSGFGSVWAGYLYAPLTFAAGFVLSPMRVLRAGRRGWRAQPVPLAPSARGAQSDDVERRATTDRALVAAAIARVIAKLQICHAAS